MDIEDNQESFAELFEKSISKNESMKIGQLIETTIVSIAGETIFLELSGKSEGVLDASELKDDEGNLTVKEGDTISVYFLSAKNGEKRFTTKISGDKAGSAMLENAYNNAIPVEGVVVKEIKGGFEIKIGESRAFCPFSQMGLRRVENAEEFVGKQLSFRIMEYKEKGRNILVSNRAILEEEHKGKVEELKSRLEEGMVVKGEIKSLRDFGAFVEIDGVQALLPISEISRDRVEDITKVLSVGQEIEAKILQLDWKRNRISLSMKRLLADPWDGIESRYSVGSKHTGEVVRMAQFGAFVSLEPGLDGLIHISALEGDPKYSAPGNRLKKGQKISVVINSIDTEKKRLSLKPASSGQVDAAVGKYMDSETESYNPFAALLKKRNDENK